MNWKAEAVKELKSYPQRLASVENIKERIKVLKEDFESLRGISAEAPVMGGCSRQEEKMLNNISERKLLGFSLKISLSLIRLTEKGFKALDEREREIIDKFYIHPVDNHVEVLCEKLHFEKSRLYEIKDNALRKFTIAMYGVVDI